MLIHDSVVWTSKLAVSPSFLLGDLEKPQKAEVGSSLSSSRKSWPCDQQVWQRWRWVHLTLMASFPHSLNNALPKALLPTASLSMGQEPQHHWTPSLQIHSNTGLQLGTNTSMSFSSCSSYFSSILSADYHGKTNQFSTCLLAVGVSPPYQLMWISARAVHWTQCHTSRESLWTLCLWLELRRITLPCPQHHLSGIVPPICDSCYSFLPGGNEGECLGTLFTKQNDIYNVMGINSQTVKSYSEKSSYTSLDGWEEF